MSLINFSQIMCVSDCTIFFFEFIYLFSAVLGFVALHGLSLVEVSGTSLAAVWGLLTAVAALAVEHGSQCSGFSSYAAQAH